MGIDVGMRQVVRTFSPSQTLNLHAKTFRREAPNSLTALLYQRRRDQHQDNHRQTTSTPTSLLQLRLDNMSDAGDDYGNGG